MRQLEQQSIITDMIGKIEKSLQERLMLISLNLATSSSLVVAGTFKSIRDDLDLFNLSEQLNEKALSFQIPNSVKATIIQCIADLATTSITEMVRLTTSVCKEKLELELGEILSDPEVLESDIGQYEQELHFSNFSSLTQSQFLNSKNNSTHLEQHSHSLDNIDNTEEASLPGTSGFLKDHVLDRPIVKNLSKASSQNSSRDFGQTGSSLTKTKRENQSSPSLDSAIRDANFSTQKYLHDHSKSKPSVFSNSKENQIDISSTETIFLTKKYQVYHQEAGFKQKNELKKESSCDLLQESDGDLFSYI